MLPYVPAAGLNNAPTRAAHPIRIDRIYSRALGSFYSAHGGKRDNYAADARGALPIYAQGSCTISRSKRHPGDESVVRVGIPARSSGAVARGGRPGAGNREPKRANPVSGA